MTRFNRQRALLVALSLLATLASVNVSAAERRRVVKVPSADALVTYSGTVLDDVTGAPVFGAVVTNEGRTATADQSGVFSIKVPSGRATTITISRWGYGSITQTITVSATPASPASFRLAPKPAVTVTESNGATHRLDFESSQFAYLIPFSGYARFDNANLCKPDGTAWTPAKGEFKKITGPATSSTSAACCKLGPVVGMQMQMRNGETTGAFFADSCFGNEVDFLGRDLATGNFLYFNLTKVSDITFE